LATHLLKETPFRWTFITGVCVFIQMHAIILHLWLKIPMALAWADSGIHNSLLAVCAACITQMLAYYRPVKGKYVFVALLTFMVSVIWLVSVYWALRSIFGSLTDYAFWLKDTLPVRFALGWLIVTGSGFISFFLYEMDEHRAALARKEAAEKMAREAELYKLRQQLQPHFLFNSLNSINALVTIRPEEARQMIQKLSDFLRGTLKKEDQLWIPLKEELQYLQLYLDIEKVRFRHRLSTSVEQSDEAAVLQIPPMLLQPVVENAIKFGLYDTTEAITIVIKAWQEHGILVVSVSNPFDPSLQQQSWQGTGFGLSSISRRLYLLFARQDLLETRIEGNIFTTLIKVPQLHDKDNTDR
jgi:sensor histidine kinase YesM